MTSIKGWNAWDIAVSALATVVLVAEAVLEAGVVPSAIVLAATMGISLALRRRYPLGSFVVNGVALLGLAYFHYEAGNYPMANLIGMYSVGAYAAPRRAVAGLVVGVFGVVGYWLIVPPDPIPALPAIVLAAWVLAWVAGQAAARRRREAKSLARRADEAERRRHTEAQQAAAEERARIAREVHDIVGHSVNVMLLQAGAARRMLEHDASASASALRTVEEVGRETLGELDRVLGLVNEEGRRPPPGIDDLADLATSFTDAGVPVRLEVRGEPKAVPRSFALSVYRIVQESLTNVAKHAAGAPAEVSLVFGEHELEVEVSDSGPGSPEGGGGRGLPGMRERVTSLGGEMSAGPEPEGGWAVRATLPLPS